MPQPSHNAGTGSHIGLVHSQRPPPPSTTHPSTKQVLTHEPCQACRRRHHDIRQRHHPTRVHPHAPITETPQRHVAVIRHRPCGKCNCWESMHGKQKKFYAHAIIYALRCIATRGRVCLHTLVDRKRKHFTTRLM